MFVYTAFMLKPLEVASWGTGWHIQQKVRWTLQIPDSIGLGAKSVKKLFVKNTTSKLKLQSGVCVPLAIWLLHENVMILLKPILSNEAKCFKYLVP